MLSTILDIARLTHNIDQDTASIEAITGERDRLTAKLAAVQARIAELTAERDRLLGQFAPTAEPQPEYTDYATANPRHTLRLHKSGYRELRDGRGECALCYPWRQPASIAARLFDALSTPMTRQQVEGWSIANKIKPGTAISYLPMLVNLGIVTSDGLTWRANDMGQK